ncbi:MAG: PEGA domain-containing protein [Deltaproteobacteria bacterium]|nr:PEGA domain-containing protein [Deltaproteobacteria bacterium]
MDDDQRKRARNAVTRVYGASRPHETLIAAVPPVPVAPGPMLAAADHDRFRPPAERALPAVVLPAPLPPRHGTMAEPARRRWRSGGFSALVITGLLAIAVVSNLERLRGVFHQVVPAADEVAVEGAIPLMLFVRSDPPAARVYINGHLVGRTPFAQGYASAGGMVHVRVEAPGYQAWESELQYKSVGVLVHAKLQRLAKLKPMMIVAWNQR